MTHHQPPNPDTPRQSLFDMVGGEDSVQRLVKVFYDIIESHPEGHKLHLLHLRGNGIAHSRVEQFNFLSGFLGGPKLYVEQHGHSNVRTMHEYVEINHEAKEIWLICMTMAIDELGLATSTKEKLMVNFTMIAERLVVAERLVNRID